MGDTYKLVFRGEVLEGQHPAVVRKRLGESAGFGNEALDKLFSGRPVVVKREADTATAARFQAVFRKAGARLRVLPVETADGEIGAASPGGASGEAGAQPGLQQPAAAAAPEGQGFELLPAGSDLLSAAERSDFTPRDIDTGGLRLEGARFAIPDPQPEVPAPDVSHLTVADPGTDLAGGGNREPAAPVSAPDFAVAETGADLGPQRPPPAAALDFDRLTFEVAPPGADLGQRQPLAAPAPPDVSHLSLAPDAPEE